MSFLPVSISLNLSCVSVLSDCCNKISETGWLKKNKNLFSPSLKAEKSKIKMLAHWGFGGSPGLWTAVFSLCPYLVEIERALASLPLLIGTLIPSWGPTLVTSSKVNDLSKASPPNTVTLGVRAST